MYGAVLKKIETGDGHTQRLRCSNLSVPPQTGLRELQNEPQAELESLDSGMRGKA